MKKESKFAVWMQQIRAPFLILAVMLVLIGVAAAASDGFKNLIHTIMLFVGVILAHISVNLFNEISDYKTKIDENTQRTPFSGGSGMLQAKKTTIKAVNVVAYSTMLIAGAIGVYFCIVSNPYIAVFMLLGGIAIRFYTSHLAKLLSGELFSGLTLGTMVVLGAYMALTGTINPNIIFISIPPGILTALLLFLNEFPDAEVDKEGGRRHLVIHFGKKKSAGMYLAGLILTYMFIISAPLFFNVPYTVLLGLLTLPIALKASIIVLKEYSNSEKLVPALGMNIMVVLGTDLLLALGYFL